MEADKATRARILEMVPQQYPFRFIDDILELDEGHIVGRYRFREDEYFYQGHFPGLPITPGVILVETMAQTGVVAFGLYLTLLADKNGGRIEDLVTLFTLAEKVEFDGIVLPGDEVVITGKKLYFRGNQLKVEVSMARPGGEGVCSGILAGRGIERARFAGQMVRNTVPAAASREKEDKDA